MTGRLATYSMFDSSQPIVDSVRLWSTADSSNQLAISESPSGLALYSVSLSLWSTLMTYNNLVPSAVPLCPIIPPHLIHLTLSPRHQVTWCPSEVRVGGLGPCMHETNMQYTPQIVPIPWKAICQSGFIGTFFCLT